MSSENNYTLQVRMVGLVLKYYKIRIVLLLLGLMLRVRLPFLTSPLSRAGILLNFNLIKSAQLLSGQGNFINSWDSLDELMLTCPLLI